METISTNNAPAAIGPYSQGIIAGDFLYTSGQIGLDPINGTSVGTDITSQATQVFNNLKAVIEAAGADMSKVCKTTCFLANMEDFPTFNQIYGKYFPSNPARSCIAAKGLPKGLLVEVEAVVYLK